MPNSRRSLLCRRESVAGGCIVLLWTFALAPPIFAQAGDTAFSASLPAAGDTAFSVPRAAGDTAFAVVVAQATGEAGIETAGDTAIQTAAFQTSGTQTVQLQTNPTGDSDPPLTFFGSDAPPSSPILEDVYPVDPSAEWGKQFESIKEDDARIRILEPEGAMHLPKPDLYKLSTEQYKVYRSDESMISFMPGGGDQFGWLSIESANYLSRHKKSGPTANVNFHLLSGPQSIDLPPRLYDFELGYQARSTLSDLFSYEWSAMVGAYSDFKGSAREGVRFPAHAVGMFHASPRADWVVGVDYLGRDDVKVLPVAGFCWHDPATPQIRYQMIFPRPRIDLMLSSEVRLYLAGLFGGGTWQIEFPDASNDVLTYRDYKLVTGIEQLHADGSLASWELGWVFGRKIEFRDRSDELSMDDAFVLRYVTRR